MGIESTFACNRQNTTQLQKQGETTKTFAGPITFELCHAQRPPRKRLSSGRQLGSYSLTFRICPPGQRLTAPLVPLERFAIRLKKRRIANQAIRIETTSEAWE